MTTMQTPTVAPATGRLGVLTVGLGAVASTLIAGVELAKRGLGEPFGSLTQMGTIRLGKRTDNRNPLIRDFVPLATLDDNAKVAWLERVDRETRAMDPRIKQVMASVSAVHEVVLVARADGLLAADVRPLVRFNVSVIAEHDGRQPVEAPDKEAGHDLGQVALLVSTRPLPPDAPTMRTVPSVESFQVVYTTERPSRDHTG